jgi:hypothetical protein
VPVFVWATVWIMRGRKSLEARHCTSWSTKASAPKPSNERRHFEETERGSDSASKSKKEQTRDDVMPRYVIERTFLDGLEIPMTDKGAATCQAVVDRNEDLSVTWVHSYVSTDKTKTYCLYDGPGEEAIRRAAERNGLPVDRITEVRVLDPYFYK